MKRYALALPLTATLALFTSTGLTLGCSKKNAEVSQGPATPVGDVPRIHAKGGDRVMAGTPAPSTPDTSFKLAVTAPPAGPAGAEAVARVSVTPSQGWHVNKEYPTKLRLSAPAAVALRKPLLELRDATKLDDNELTFDVVVVASTAGTFQVDGDLKFAVCTPETCDPKQQPITFELIAR